MSVVQKFTELNSPYIASIVQERTVNGIIANILNAEHDGADAFMVDLSRLSRDARNKESLYRIFHTSCKPMMPLLYRGVYMLPTEYSDEDRVKEMMACIDAGASAIDVMGDIFDPSPHELTSDPNAIEKQKELIAAIHDKKAEVLMSSHTTDIMCAEEILEHLKQQEERGADIAKIIVGCNTEDDLLESFRTTLLLKKEMNIPFVHLCNGRLGRLQRWFAPMLGSCLNFAVERYNEDSFGSQPTVLSARRVLNEMLWHAEL